MNKRRSKKKFKKEYKMNPQEMLEIISNITRQLNAALPAIMEDVAKAMQAIVENGHAIMQKLQLTDDGFCATGERRDDGVQN